MKRMPWLMFPMLVLVTGCGLTFATPKPQVPDKKQIFLNYVPPNEPGAPHDMEYLVEHDAGDGGYYGTKYFPGTIQITEYPDSSLLNYNNQQTVTSSGVKTKRVKSGSTIVLNDVLWIVDWKINNYPYSFWMFQFSKSHRWGVVGKNQLGTYLLSVSGQ